MAAALVLGMNQPARAQGVTNMAKLTCAQLLEGSANAIESATWLSGYYNGLTGAVPIQSDKLVARSRPFSWWSKPDVGRQNHS